MAKVTPIRPALSAIRKERVKQILDARDSINRGLEMMRIICSAFDTDGSLHFTTKAVDLHAGLGRAIGHIENAADQLFAFRSEEADGQESQAFMDVLWDSADVAICVKTVLKHKRLPDGHGMTVCPARGALTVAIGKLEGLVRDITAFVASVRIPAGPIGRATESARRRTPVAAKAAVAAHG